jgi:hypothetical protein
MGMIKIVGLGMAFLGSAALWAGAAETKMPLAKNPPKVFLDATRLRSTKTEGGDFDDKMQKVQLDILVRNLSLKPEKLEPLTLHYWALGQSAANRKAYKVIDAGTVEVALDGTLTGREFHHQGDEATLQYDDTGVARFGVAYKGYLLVLLNAQKEVVAVKANQSAWQTNFEEAFNLKKNAWCDLNFKPTAAPKY